MATKPHEHHEAHSDAPSEKCDPPAAPAKVYEMGQGSEHNDDDLANRDPLAHLKDVK